jgi:hypothetical protein
MKVKIQAVCFLCISAARADRDLRQEGRKVAGSNNATNAVIGTPFSDVY